MKRMMITAAVGLALLAAPVAAKPPLRDVPAIDDALLDLGIADRIRKNCPDISARMLTAIGYLYGLKDKARDLGYSDAEIEAYVDSDAEKARMKARGAAFFKARGVDTSDPQSYCALGRAEIQKSSRIGSLLKAK
ncbi:MULTISPECIES: DUF5333 domain-containing protein [unclassified Sulfitobacter]|jgi:Family of unknown function (DUF5333)|uniref:DUF5333 domain-containing protein n=1 Tax=unclassified Sulfitobacter TaxID=196795 RepID=UPI0007C37062|nr:MULTISPECIES: DUF5333 domain-containing protein [unclassified Sulfitobacter]KZY05689.1 hypothetical protein A3721_14030 [Sulfitobacter sp. HI0023]KZY22316.1 hypothetical protein A3728_11230 [Sulfitobacter sp. HI0040]KZZ70147.1 hypothetical protein A3764_08515 [Sulfitobacter sp. HI0129]